ncbi:MAG: hypothetical protein LUH10_09225 [Tannerellaceae bacterium]|nr:hypothetical protein [Tannerellaceae bacterium]
MKPVFEVDFNEIIDDRLILLSKTDKRKDINGNVITLIAGMHIQLIDVDYDDNGNRDDLIAEGVVIPNTTALYQTVKWCCKIDENRIRHTSDIKR